MVELGAKNMSHGTQKIPCILYPFLPSLGTDPSMGETISSKRGRDGDKKHKIAMAAGSQQGGRPREPRVEAGVDTSSVGPEQEAGRRQQGSAGRSAALGGSYGRAGRAAGRCARQGEGQWHITDVGQLKY